MKLLIVHQRYPPEGGGAEAYTAALARELSGRHEVAVLHGIADVSRPAGELRRSAEDDVRLFSVNTVGRGTLGFRAYRDPRIAAAAGIVLDQFKPDLVHAGSLAGLSTGIVFEARRRGVPVVLTLHDFWPVCPLGQLLNRRLEVCHGPAAERCLGCIGEQVVSRSAWVRSVGRHLPGLASVGRLLSRTFKTGAREVAERLDEMLEVLRAADIVTAPSRFLCDRMHALGAPAVEHLALGLARPTVPPRRPVPRSGQVRFGYLGALIPSKGVHVLAEAYRLLDDPRASLSLHGAFVPYHGDTDYEARLRAILGEHSMSVLLGPFRKEALGDVLSGLDVIVVPSLWEENAPLVVGEAFLAGLPVIVSDHGGLREMVRDDLDGLRVPPGDAQALACAMRRFLEDGTMHARLVANAPQVPSMAEHVAALESVYARARERLRTRPSRIGVIVLDCGRPLDAERAALSAQDTGLDVHVLIVENDAAASGRTSFERLHLAENRGFAGGVNAGLARLSAEGCDLFLLLNDDALLEPGCLRRLAEALEDPTLAAVGPVILRSADGLVESRGLGIDLRWGRVRLEGHGERPPDREGRVATSALSGAVMMLSRAALDRVGPFDEDYFFSFEDVDWCLRAREAGLNVAVVLGARARHLGSQSIGRQSPERLYYAARNHLRLAEKLLPLRGAGRWQRRAVILALNLAYGLRQQDVPRLRAVLAGFRDACAGRFGPCDVAGQGRRKGSALS